MEIEHEAIQNYSCKYEMRAVKEESSSGQCQRMILSIQVTTEPDEVKQRDLWVTDFVPMQNIYKLVLAMTSKEIGKSN
jgi:hypothetical protein